jgi:hypothetical protein
MALAVPGGTATGFDQLGCLNSVMGTAFPHEAAAGDAAAALKLIGSIVTYNSRM